MEKKNYNPQILVDHLEKQINYEVQKLCSANLSIRQEYHSFKHLAENKVTVLLSKNSELSSKLYTQEENNQSICERLSEVVQQNCVIAENNHKLIAEKDELMQRICETEQSNSLLFTTNQELLEQLEKYAEEKRILEMKLSAKCADFDRVRKNCDNLQQQLCDMMGQKQELKLESNDRFEKYESLKRECQNLDQRFSYEISRHQIETAELNTKIRQAEDNIRLEQEANENLLQEVESLKKEKCLLETVLDDKTKTEKKVGLEFRNKIKQIYKKKVMEITAIKVQRDIELQNILEEMKNLKDQLQELMEEKYNLRSTFLEESQNQNSSTKVTESTYTLRIVDDIERKKLHSNQKSNPTSQTLISSRRSCRNKRKLGDVTTTNPQTNTSKERNSLMKKLFGVTPTSFKTSKGENPSSDMKQVVTLSDSEDGHVL